MKLKKWPIADLKLDNKYQGEVKAYVGKKMVASSTAEAPDWDTGTVKLMVGSDVADSQVEKDDTITLTYSYVTADQVIQVDVEAPEMKSIPADNGETDYAAGAIQFIWSDAGEVNEATGKYPGEYRGDTHDTVTLNSATHEGPSGTSTDITDMLTTNDDKRWVYHPAEALPLGNHEFTLKATDAAGNEAEVTINFMVVERKPVEVELSPGWNLISFRGAPASSDANDIFGADSGISVVSQYDGRKVSPWTVWTRGEDGTLSSSPAGNANIDPGLGLYVLSSDGSTLEVDIPGTSKDAPAEVPPSIDLIAGWNLVAIIIIDRNETSVGVNEYLPAGVWSRAFYLDNATGQLRSISPPTVTENIPAGTAINAGQALWVYATKAGTIVPK